MIGTMLRLAAGAIVLGVTAATAGDFDTLRVAGVSTFMHMISGPGISGAVLSPDGAQLIHVGNRDEICVYDLSGAEPRQAACERPDERMVAPDDMRWSPDGTLLLWPLAVDAFQRFRDTDIKVLDPAAFTVTNLTDDHFDDSLMGNGPGNLDVAAQWLDADTIVFIRNAFGAEGITSRQPGILMSVDRGGEPKELLAPPAEGKGIAFGLDISDDGATIAYILGDSDAPERAGIYLFEVGGTAPRRIAAMSEFGELPSVIAFSADGAYLMVTGRDGDGFSVGALIETATGKVTTISADRRIIGLGWSPTGSALAYIVRGKDGGSQPNGLYVAEPPTGPGRLLEPGAFMPPVCCSQPLIWASNDTMVLGNLEKMDQPFLVRFQR